MSGPATRSAHPGRLLAGALLVLSLLPQPASSRTFCFPHVFESRHGTATSGSTFDSFIHMAYTSELLGIPGGGSATAELYLYDVNTWAPLESATGTVVCNPCTYTFTDGTTGVPALRQLSVCVGDEIEAHGGFVDDSPIEAFAVLRTTGDVDHLEVTGSIVNSHTGPLDLAEYGYNPKEVTSADKRVFVLPHVFEREGLTASANFAFDTYLNLMYAAGLGGTPAGPGATVELYLYAPDGTPWSGSSGPVCNPCMYQLDSSAPFVSVPLEPLIAEAGGFGGLPIKAGFAVLRTGGADPDNVAAQHFVVNRHTGPFDLSVFGFDPQPVLASASVGVESGTAGAQLNLSSFPNPATGDMTLSFSLDQESDVRLEVYDAAGRRVGSVFDGLRAAGQHRVRWQPRDAQGKRLASGVYFGRITTRDGVRSTRVVWLP